MNTAEVKPHRKSWDPGSRHGTGPYLYTAGGLAVVSQVFHMWALQEQFLFRPLVGGLMFLVAMLQGILAAGLVLSPGKWTLRYGILLNTGVVVVWVTTRFAGYPGLLGFDYLPVGLLNSVVVICEMSLVALLVVLLMRSQSPKTS